MNNDQWGFIANLKDNFGFIETLGGKDNLFFHFNAVVGRDRPQLRDEVRFDVEIDRRSGREAASRVFLLAPGTLPKPPPPVEMQARCVVERELRNASRGPDGAGGRLLVRSTLPTGGEDGGDAAEQASALCACARERSSRA